MSEERPTAKVVSMCGRPIVTGPAEEGHDPEAAAARRQLTHWASEAVSYVGLFLTAEGVAFASSSEDAARILQMATVLKMRAEAFAVADLCEDDEDEDDEPA